MAEQRFVKGTEEYVLFNDYWKLCQSFWIPEDDDMYWEKLHNAAIQFGKHSEFAKMLALAYLSEMERKFKGGK